MRLVATGLDSVKTGEIRKLTVCEHPYCLISIQLKNRSNRFERGYLYG